MTMAADNISQLLRWQRTASYSHDDGSRQHLPVMTMAADSIFQLWRWQQTASSSCYDDCSRHHLPAEVKRSSSDGTDLAIDFQPNWPTTFKCLVILTLPQSSFNYDADQERVWITLGDWPCSLETFILGSTMRTNASLASLYAPEFTPSLWWVYTTVAMSLHHRFDELTLPWRCCCDDDRRQHLQSACPLHYHFNKIIITLRFRLRVTINSWGTGAQFSHFCGAI